MVDAHNPYKNKVSHKGFKVVVSERNSKTNVLDRMQPIKIVVESESGTAPPTLRKSYPNKLASK